MTSQGARSHLQLLLVAYTVVVMAGVASAAIPAYVDCEECLYKDGVSTIGYLEDIEDQCSYWVCEPQGYQQYRVHSQTCAPGTGWSQILLACVTNALCEGDGSGEIEDDSEETQWECDLEADPSDPAGYLQTLPSGSKIPRPCAPGTRFDADMCACVNTGQPHQTVGEQCRIEYYILQPGYKPDEQMYPMDLYGNIAPNGFLPGPGIFFNGVSDFTSIERFNNWFSHKSKWAAMLWIRPHPGSSSRAVMGVISNSDCQGTSSVQLVIRYGKLYGGFDTGEFQETEGVELIEDQWNQVIFSHYPGGAELTVTTLTSPSVTKLITTGDYIENRQCGIVIGRMSDASGHHYYHGLLTNLGIHTC